MHFRTALVPRARTDPLTEDDAANNGGGAAAGRERAVDFVRAPPPQGRHTVRLLPAVCHTHAHTHTVDLYVSVWKKERGCAREHTGQEEEAGSSKLTYTRRC